MARTGVQSWRQEDAFAKELFRRTILAMSSNTAYLGTNRTNTFHYQKFQRNEIIVYRKRLAIVGTPVSTADNKRRYYNALEALDFFSFLTIVMESVWLFITIIILWR